MRSSQIAALFASFHFNDLPDVFVHFVGWLNTHNVLWRDEELGGSDIV